MKLDLYPDEVAVLTNYNPDERRISIFTDSEMTLHNLQSIATQMQLTVLLASSINDGMQRLREYVADDAILVDVAHADDARIGLFFDQIEQVGRTTDLPVLVNCTPECLDAAAILLSAPSVSLLCDATPAEWITALAMLGVPRAPVLHDAAVDETIRLQRLAEEVQRIAKTLSDLVSPGAPPLSGVNDAMIGFRAGTTSYTPPPVSVTAVDVRGIIRLRRMRDRFFRGDLFADPAWDMLLDLMAARFERLQVSVSSLCIAAAVPPTTALRWIKTMCDNGMFIRVADPEDGRRVFIELSDATAAAMSNYLGAAKAQNGLLV